MGFGDSEYKTNAQFWDDFARENYSKTSYDMERVAYNTAKVSSKAHPSHAWAVMHHDTIIVESTPCSLAPGAHPQASHRVTVRPWDSSTTRARLCNHAPGVQVYVHRSVQYMTMQSWGTLRVDDEEAVYYDYEERSGRVWQVLDAKQPMLNDPWAPMLPVERRMRRVLNKAAMNCPPVASNGTMSARPGTGGAHNNPQTGWIMDYIPPYSDNHEALEAFCAQLEVLAITGPQRVWQARDTIADNCGLRPIEEQHLSIHSPEARRFINAALRTHKADTGKDVTYGDVKKYYRAYKLAMEVGRS